MSWDDAPYDYEPPKTSSHEGAVVAGILVTGLVVFCMTMWFFGSVH